MLKVRTTPNLYGVTLMGDYDDLDKLYDSINNYLAFYQDNSVWFQYHEYEYMLALNYDIRHCYQGDRGYEAVDNCADRFEDLGSPDFGLPVEIRKEYRKLFKDLKNGNLYYAFYTSSKPVYSVELRGLEAGKTYRVDDYYNHRNLGLVTASQSTVLDVEINGSLLVEVSEVND